MNRPRLRVAMPLAAVGVGTVLAAAAPGMAAVSNASVPHPTPAPKPVVNLAIGTTAGLPADGKTAVVHLTVTCPTGYRGAVVADLTGRSKTRGSVHAVGAANVTCTGAAQKIDVTARMFRGERRALKAGPARVVAHLAVAPTVKQHGKGKSPVRTATAVRSVTLG